MKLRYLLSILALFAFTVVLFSLPFIPITSEVATPPQRHVIFAADTTSCLTAGGEVMTVNSPYVENGIVWLPLEDTITALGGETDGDTAQFGDSSFDLTTIHSSLHVDHESSYIPARILADTLDLNLLTYDGLFVLSEQDSLTPSPIRTTAAQLLGFTGYTDRSETLLQADPAYVVDPYVKYSYDTLLGDLKELEERYPALISVFSIGESVEGRDIPAFTLGNGERAIYYGATIHAGEYITTNIIMYMADRYAYGYYADEQPEGCIRYRELLDNVTFYIVPMINPDGVNIAQNGYHASTLPVASYDRQGVTWPGAYKANANGVDLNRNFPYKWNPMNENGITWRCMRYFCGFEAASEPETQALIRLGEAVDFEMFADFHKFGEQLFWVDSDTTDHVERYGHIAERMADAFSYELIGIEPIHHFGGYFSNYMRNTYDIFSLTVETCEFWSLPESMFDSIAGDVYHIGLIMGEELLNLPDEARWLRVEIDGRTLPSAESTLLADDRLSSDRLSDIVTACGGKLVWAEDGTVTVSFEGMQATATARTSLFPCVPDLWAQDEQGRLVNATDLLARVGIGASVQGTTAVIHAYR